jgi:hypothetical protein
MGINVLIITSLRINKEREREFILIFNNNNNNIIIIIIIIIIGL